MDELFQQLEIRIRTIAERCEQLERDNAMLQQNQLLLIREKEALTAKNKIAISQIENMIFRLKFIESTS
jgi:uncharacterized protein (TIGR02449 family)